MKKRIWAAGIVALMGIQRMASATTQYTITEIPVVGNDSVGYAYGINNLGQVVGFSSDITDPRIGVRHAYLFSNGQLSTLGVPSTASDSVAYSINDFGQIVGAVNQNAFIYTGGQLMPIPVNAALSYGISINNLGQVTGFGYSTIQQTQYTAFLFNSSTNTTTPLTLSGWKDTNGEAINNKGVVIGGLYGDQSGSSGDSFIYQNGVMTNITNSIGLYAATAINDNGEIVGYSTEGQAFYYKGSSLVALAPYQGASVQPESVNNSGVIVGYSVTDQQVSTAFIYTNGSLQNLNTLVSNSGWNLQTAMSVNNEGDIVGQGLDPQGNERAYILTPIPEPRSMALIFLAAAAFLLRRSRRIPQA